ncbi:MAG TPA: cytochrome d ubiquinol oxidase subunit II [Syntrophorhabdaceae bacterium]|nr:cytochrome d ubiquinol oxidase subunit II [Syntrophorhabdaceae bacterium]
MMNLVDIWAALVGFAMILYVILDGISLGVALLFGFMRGETERDTLMGSIAPVWDANQTWLLFGGGAIFAAFPLVYAVFSSALYIPLVTFISGLIFRGVTFEFRSEAKRKQSWDGVFCVGSLVAVLSQGLMLGGILTGIHVSQGQFSGGPFDWFNPFSVMVAIALIPGYVMLASTYLVLKTVGPVQARAFTHALWSGLAVLGFMVIVTVWTPAHYPLVWTTWFSAPRIYFVWVFPATGLVAAYRLIVALKRREESMPLVYAVILFLSGYLGLATSLYPFAIPPSITIREASAQPETMRFTLWGAIVVLPMVLGYVIYSYSVFRGKVNERGYYGS